MRKCLVLHIHLNFNFILSPSSKPNTIVTPSSVEIESS